MFRSIRDKKTLMKVYLPHRKFRLHFKNAPFCGLGVCISSQTRAFHPLHLENALIYRHFCEGKPALPVITKMQPI